jgi:hypothetical protein
MRGVAIFGLFRLSTAMLAALAIVSGCAGNDPRPEEARPAPRQNQADLRSGHACCNLHYDGDRISDSNRAQLPFLAAGTPIRVRNIDGFSAEILADGKAMRLVLEQGRSPEAMQAWVERLVVAEDPRVRLERFPAATRNAIKAGQLMKGMTREQVVMAVGPPQGGEDKRADAPSWRYWWSSFGPYYVYWGKGGSVARIDGQAEAVAQMIYKGR